MCKREELLNGYKRDPGPWSLSNWYFEILTHQNLHLFKRFNTASFAVSIGLWLWENMLLFIFIPCPEWLKADIIIEHCLNNLRKYIIVLVSSKASTIICIFYTYLQISSSAFLWTALTTRLLQASVSVLKNSVG